MLQSLTSLKSDVARVVSLWQREAVTATETVGWLLDHFAFVVRDFPDARSAVAEALAIVPAPLLTGMADRLAKCRLVEGRWHWPPGGSGLPTPGNDQPWGMAGPTEADALDVLGGWLRDRSGNG